MLTDSFLINYFDYSMKRALPIFILFFYCLFTSAQISEKGYFVTKEGVRYNEVDILNPNHADCYERVHVSSEELSLNKFFYPKDIASYGLDYGYRFISAKIMIDTAEVQVFLKELIRDWDINIYKSEYKGKARFYTIDRQTGKYIEIKDNGSEFRRLLQKRAEMSNCDVIDDLNNIQLKMTETSIMSLYEAYTNCSVNNYPGIKWGVAVNAGYSFFNFDDEVRFNIPNKPYAMPGLFVDIPIDNRISFRPELYYFYTKTKNKPYDGSFKYYRHSLIVPLMLRYRFSNVNGNTIPYIEMGATFDVRLAGKTKYKEYYGISSYMVEKNCSNVHVGPEFGAGIEHKLTDDLMVYVGVRGAYYFSATTSDKKEHRSNVSFNVGIGF